jgi:hypothetical protein
MLAYLGRKPLAFSSAALLAETKLYSLYPICEKNVEVNFQLSLSAPADIKPI